MPVVYFCTLFGAVVILGSAQDVTTVQGLLESLSDCGYAEVWCVWTGRIDERGAEAFESHKEPITYVDGRQAVIWGSNAPSTYVSWQFPK